MSPTMVIAIWECFGFDTRQTRPFLNDWPLQFVKSSECLSPVVLLIWGCSELCLSCSRSIYTAPTHHCTLCALFLVCDGSLSVQCDCCTFASLRPVPWMWRCCGCVLSLYRTTRLRRRQSLVSLFGWETSIDAVRAVTILALTVMVLSAEGTDWPTSRLYNPPHFHPSLKHQLNVCVCTICCTFGNKTASVLPNLCYLRLTGWSCCCKMYKRKAKQNKPFS